MTDYQIGMSLVGLLVILIFMRVPIGVSLIGVSFAGLCALVGWRAAWASLGTIPYQFSASWVLSSVPAFLFMGYICYHTKITEGLFNAARAWLSRLPGGLAIASVFGCAGFAAITGSSVACAAAMGKMAVPEMIKRGYSAELSTGTVAAAGTIGALIPPSILMILYGIMAQIPLGELFLGGLTVGMMTMAIYVATILIRVKLNPKLAPAVTEHISFREKVDALLEIWPVLLIVAGVFGGLFSGLFTATEAGATGAFLSCVVAMVKGKLTWRAVRSSTLETLVTMGALMIIAIGADLLSRFLTLSGVGDQLQQAVLSFGADPLTIIVVLVVLYILLGTVLEPIGMMMLTLPVVLPILTDAGISLVWFGILLTKLMEMGVVSPPVGMNVFVIKSVVGNLVSTTTIFRGILWFFVADLVLVALLVAFPGMPFLFR